MTFGLQVGTMAFLALDPGAGWWTSAFCRRLRLAGDCLREVGSLVRRSTYRINAWKEAPWGLGGGKGAWRGEDRRDVGPCMWQPPRCSRARRGGACCDAVNEMAA